MKNSTKLFGRIFNSYIFLGQFYEPRDWGSQLTESVRTELAFTLFKIRERRKMRTNNSAPSSFSKTARRLPIFKFQSGIRCYVKKSCTFTCIKIVTNWNLVYVITVFLSYGRRKWNAIYFISTIFGYFGYDDVGAVLFP